MQPHEIKLALISVSEKKGIIEFAQELTRCDIKILATGGTATLLKQHGIAVSEVSSHTGFPEILDGRVKTLHPKIHGGLLASRTKDQSTLTQHEITPIDLLVVNLYPFSQTTQDPNCQLKDAVEQIDIGGPSMLRSAAKNNAFVTAVIDPEDYSEVLTQIRHNKKTTNALRMKLAQKVFKHTADYDRQIADYLAKETQQNSTFSQSYQPQFKLIQELRYGENPHQKAAFYCNEDHVPGTLSSAKQIQGKSLSYNNLIDADTALQCVQQLNRKKPACVIVKHATPCGAAASDSPEQAYHKALLCDTESAYGGIIAFNCTVDPKTAAMITAKQFAEVVLAPSFDRQVLDILQSKPQLRVLAYGKQWSVTNQALVLRSISGGLLVQQNDCVSLPIDDLIFATQRKPTDSELSDLLFAWQVVKFTQSNAIVFVKDKQTLGIGAGQTSRVFSAKIAALRASMAEHDLAGAVLASDAFFPFADSISIASELGISAIIQPGGSKRDDEVIAAADSANLAMVFTNRRHFRH